MALKLKKEIITKVRLVDEAIKKQTSPTNLIEVDVDENAAYIKLSYINPKTHKVTYSKSDVLTRKDIENILATMRSMPAKISAEKKKAIKK